MKKLLILFMSMGLVAAVNAQTTAQERDIITEQVINTVNSLKINSEKLHNSTSTNLGFLSIEKEVSNPFQYIKQPADYISIASTSYYLVIIDTDEVGGLGEELMLEMNTGANAGHMDKGDAGCAQISNG